MTLLMLENKEKTFLLEQKKRPDRRNKSIKRTTRSRKEQLNEIEKLKNELEKEKNKGFFARLFGK